MVKRVINKLSMYIAVLGVLRSHQSIVAGVKALDDAVKLLTDLLREISGKSEEASQKGKVALKGEREQNVVDSALVVSSGLYALASSTNDAELKEKTRTTRSALMSLRDLELITFGRTSLALAVDRAAQLADYNVTQEAIGNLEQAIVGFVAAMEATAGERSARKGASQSRLSLLDEVDQLLNERIDKLMITVRPSQPEFFDEYKAARVIRDLGGARVTLQAESQPPQPATA